MELSFSVTFYLAHGALHKSTFLYKHVHKLHHTFHESIGFAAQYSHVFENAIAGLHVFIALALVRPHVVVFFIYLFTRYVETTDAHSGYEVPWRFLYPWASCYPWSCGTSMHDYHHSHNLGTYGGGILSLDMILGTDKEFKEFQKKNKNKKLLESKQETEKLSEQGVTSGNDEANSDGTAQEEKGRDAAEETSDKRKSRTPSRRQKPQDGTSGAQLDNGDGAKSSTTKNRRRSTSRRQY